MFAMLLRTLISEGKIIHQTTIDDPSSSTGRRVVRIEREGPISLVITTTGELHAHETAKSRPDTRLSTMICLFHPVLKPAETGGHRDQSSPSTILSGCGSRSGAASSMYFFKTSR